MTGRQSDKYSMLLVVIDFLKKSDGAVLTRMPGFLGLMDEFEVMLARLRELNIGQRKNYSGLRVSKLQLRAEMTALSLDMGYCVTAYAGSIGDMVLEQEMNFKEHLLNKYRQVSIVSACRFIHSKAEGLLSELDAYGVSIARLEELKDAIDEYDFMIPKTRCAIVKRMICTSEIKELLEDFDVLFTRMDGLVKIVRRYDGLFFDSYFMNRKVIRRGTRKLALHGQVVDEDGVPIGNVVVRIATKLVITSKSGEKGNYLFKRLPGGVWPVTFSKVGFVSETVYLAVTRLCPQKFNVQLKREAAPLLLEA
ncbi:carboxypeptidase-like regulatory domain-containing protein [Flavobacterium sp.]